MTQSQLKQLSYCFDGLRYSFDLAVLCSTRLQNTLSDLLDGNAAQKDCRLIEASAVLDAWALVDCTHRIREILEAVPTLRKRTHELCLFRERTAAIENLRNYHQHLRTEIPRITANSHPIWGGLTWVDDRENCHLLFTGSMFPGATVEGCSFDCIERRYSQRLVLKAGGQSIDLLNLSDEVQKIRAFLVKWLTEQNGIEVQQATRSQIFTIRVSAAKG